MDDPLIQVECTVDYPKVISILTGMDVDVEQLDVDPVDYFVLNYLADEDGVLVLSEEEVVLSLVDKLYGRAEQAWDDLNWKDDEDDDNGHTLASLGLVKLAMSAIINNENNIQPLLLSNYTELM